MRAAWREIRLHPGRFVSVLTAIVLSVGFLALSQVFVNTEGNALAMRQSAWSSGADIVVRAVPKGTADGAGSGVGSGTDTDAMKRLNDAITSVPGVKAAENSGQSFLELTNTRDESRPVIVMSVPRDPALGWVRPSQGRLPQAADEIAVQADLASALGVGIGGTLTTSTTGRPQALKVVGLLPGKSLLLPSALIHRDLGTLVGTIDPTTWIVKVDGDVATVRAALEATLTTIADRAAGNGSQHVPFVRTSADFRHDELQTLAQDLDVVKNMLMIFGVIALVVGSIIIATTFAILVAQRRRQTGLLRAVGATRGQVFRRFLAEAVLLGVLGSVLGILVAIGLGALISGVVTGSIMYGLKVPWGALAAVGALGITVTTVAALWPLRASLSVKPLEALQPVLTAGQQRRSTVVLGIVCGLLVASGAVLAVLALRAEETDGVPLVLGTGVLVTLGVLGAARLYVPALLRLLGIGFSRLGPVGRLAALNSRRNPQRAGSTAVALMMAVGLIVTLMVGQSSLKASGTRELDARYPIDLMMTVYAEPTESGEVTPVPPLTAAEIATVKATAYVADAVAVRSVASDLGPLLELTPQVRRALPSWQAEVGDGEILVPAGTFAPETDRRLQSGDAVTIKGDGGNVVTLRARIGRVPEGTHVVNEQTFRTLGAHVQTVHVMMRLTDIDRAVDVQKKLTRAFAPQRQINIDGGALLKSMFTKVLDVMLLVVLGLLGAATAIALLGVGNTLALSVVERTRESALLRALGLQASGLRWMLVIEAVMLSLVAALVGVAFGILFGWLGVTVIGHAAEFTHIALVIEWPMVGAVIGVALLAGVLGSVLPGRRAASAAPVEALADVG